MEPLVIETVLHPTDLTDTDFGAVAHALKIALAARGRLTHLHVGLKKNSVHWRDFPQTRKVLAAWGVLPEDAEHDAVLDIGLSVRKSLRKGDDLGIEIGGEIRKAGADLIVLATGRRSRMARWFRKDVAADLARRIQRPILFVPKDIDGFVDLDTGTVTLANIVVPSTPDLDPTPAIEAALGVALVVAPGPVHLHVVHVGDEEEQPEYDDPKLREGWKFERLVRDGSLAGAVLEEAEAVSADLIVMPVFEPLGWLDKFRGTDTEKVIRGAGCPVMTVPD